MTDSLLEVLTHCWTNGCMSRSDFARTHAETIGEAACRGLITLKCPISGDYLRKWQITPKGCRKLFKKGKGLT